MKRLLLATRRFRDPASDSQLPRTLADDEPLPADFLGTTIEDCRAWTFKMCKHKNAVESYMMVIADERSALDGTVSFQHFFQGMGDDPLTFDGYGALPSQRDCWHEWSVDATMAHQVYVDFMFQEPDSVYPVYFGERARLTDEDGIFDVERAQRWLTDWDIWFDCSLGKPLDVEALERRHPPTRREGWVVVSGDETDGRG